MAALLVLLALIAGFAAGALVQRSTDPRTDSSAAPAASSTPPSDTAAPNAPSTVPPASSAPPTKPPAPTAPEPPVVALPDLALPALPFRCADGAPEMVRLGEAGTWTDPAGRGTLSLTAATTATLAGSAGPSTIAAVSQQCAGAGTPLVTLVLVGPSGEATVSDPAATSGLLAVDRINVDATGVITVSGLLSLPDAAPGAAADGSLQFRCGTNGFERLTR